MRKKEGGLVKYYWDKPNKKNDPKRSSLMYKNLSLGIG